MGTPVISESLSQGQRARQLLLQLQEGMLEMAVMLRLRAAAAGNTAGWADGTPSRV